MTTDEHLLDANVLLALTISDHVHHDAVERWWVERCERFATCPITQGALVRHLLRAGVTSSEAREVLVAVIGHERHTFWADTLGYDVVSLRGVVGHQQVTDAYLAALARTRHAHVVTLDRGLAALHPDVALLLER